MQAIVLRVLPIIALPVFTTSLPSHTIATTGALHITEELSAPLSYQALFAGAKDTLDSEDVKVRQCLLFNLKAFK